MAYPITKSPKATMFRYILCALSRIFSLGIVQLLSSSRSTIFEPGKQFFMTASFVPFTQFNSKSNAPAN